MRSIAPLAALALFLAAAPAAAATRWFSGSPDPLPGASRGEAESRIELAALEHVRARSAELGLAGVELAADKTVDAGAAGRIVHFEQRVARVPVVGGGVTVRLGDDGKVRRVGVDVGTLASLDTEPTLDDAAAFEALTIGVDADLPEPERIQLVALRIGGGRLAWQLDVRDSPGGTRYWVDAHSGELIGRRSLAMDAMGTVYTVNSVDTPVPENVELTLIDTTAVPVKLNGWGGLLTVTNYVSGSSMGGYTVDQTVVPSSGEDFLYPPPADVHDATDAFAQVNLYYHLTTIRTRYQNLGATVDAPSWKITAVANALEDGQPLDNAFFTNMGITGPFAAPNMIAIGQGTLNDFAYDSDVFKHEFGHYVAYNQINYNLGQENIDELGLSPFSGAIDEGVADYFACSDNDDPQVGEATLFPLMAGRDLTVTTKKCPDDMIAEVHADGEIIGSVSWSIRTALGEDMGDKVIWGAISSLIPGASFKDFSDGVVSTVDAFVESGNLTADDKTTVTGILADRGLDECGRIIPLTEGKTSHTFIFGLDLLAMFFGVTCAQAAGFGVELPSLFHYSWTAGGSDEGVEFTAAVTADGGGALDYTIYARRTDPVSFKPGAGGLVPAVDQSDYAVVQSGPDGKAVIDSSSDPPFEPGATYDFVIVNRSCPNLAIDVAAAKYAPPVSEGGGGAGSGGSPSDGGAGGSTSEGGSAGSADDEDDGCGCKTVGTGGEDRGGAALAIAAVALAFSRRRRRR